MNHKLGKDYTPAPSKPITLFWHSYEHGYCLSNAPKADDNSFTITVTELSATSSLQHLLRMPQGFAFNSYALYSGRMYFTMTSAVDALKLMLKAFANKDYHETINKLTGDTELTLFVADKLLREKIKSQLNAIRANIIPNIPQLEAAAKREPVPLFQALARAIVEAEIGRAPKTPDMA